VAGGVSLLVGGCGGSPKANARAVGLLSGRSGRVLLMRRSNGPGFDGDVDVTALDETGRISGRPAATGLRCARVSYAAGEGLCLQRARDPDGDARVEIFDRGLHVLRTLPVQGIPSRARVSANGRRASVTTFVSGDSYAAPGDFSTRTTIIDMSGHAPPVPLESLTILDGSQQVTAIDVNLWGVTFAADADHFYATMATAGRTYLIHGSIDARSARVVHRDVECPSLSTDGTRIGYKQPTGRKDRRWHLAVLDVASGRGHLVAEPASVDDQVAWLGDTALMYERGGDLWTLPSDGSGHPRLMARGFGSPSVAELG